jgi:cytochrome c-type biogenesis protein
MNNIRELVEQITTLTPFAVAVVALAGLILGVAPSSFPLLLVAAGMAAGQGAADPAQQRIQGLWLSTGFALGIVTMDTLLGALFGLMGLAVLRVLVSHLGIAYTLIAVILSVIGLALLRVIHIVIPTLAPTTKPDRSFLGSYLLGLPFGLSTCPACTPLLLPVVAAAAFTADPWMGAVLMFTFGLARGVPIVLAGTMAGTLAHLRRSHGFILWAERIGGAAMLGAATYFFYQAAVFIGWLAP